MHEFLVVDKYHERRGLDRNLGDIEKFESLALVRRRLLHGHGFCHDLIKHTGLYSQRMVLSYGIYHLI